MKEQLRLKGSAISWLVFLAFISLVVVVVRQYAEIQSLRSREISLIAHLDDEITAPIDPFPVLDFPIEYFDADPVTSGFSDFDTIDSPLNFHSYPTTSLSLNQEQYVFLSTPLPPIKSDKEIFSSDPESDFMGSKKQEAIDKYGDLARRYLGGPGEGLLIQDVNYTDVDDDEHYETIVSLYEIGANIGSTWGEILKGNQVIYSSGGLNFSNIRPSSNGNGFYVDWVNSWDDPDNYKGRKSYTTTKFVFKNGEFIPILEQQSVYLRITPNN